MTRRLLAPAAGALLLTLTALPGAAVHAAVPSAAQITVDADSDGLSDEEELEIGTDPNKADSDDDGLSDGFEAREFGTDPLEADSDQDRLNDGDELETFKTDALRGDSDEDGFGDADEIDAGTDPNDPNSVPGDVTERDRDGDGLSDEREGPLGTDPDKADTDGDGLTDGEEVLNHDTDALKVDTDFDGFNDGAEIRAGTNPLDRNSFPVDEDDPTPAPTPKPTTDKPAAEQVKGLPNTGVGVVASSDSSDSIPYALLAAGILLALAGMTRLARRA